MEEKGRGDLRKVSLLPSLRSTSTLRLSVSLPDPVMEYRNPENQKLYHHKMTIKKLKKETTTNEALDYLKKKHYHYFIPKVIDEQQIESTHRVIQN